MHRLTFRQCVGIAVGVCLTVAGLFASLVNLIWNGAVL